MTNFKTATAALVLGVTLAATAPALAAQRIHHPGYAARAQAIPGQASPGDIGDGTMSSHRAKALRECNDLAGRQLQYLWGSESNDAYRACMAQRGEIE
jgi:hypothetical protein